MTTLQRLVITSRDPSVCREIGEARDQGEPRPSCVGEGEQRGDLPGTTLKRSQFEQLPTGTRVQDIVKRLPGVVTGGGPGEDKDARVLGLDKEYTRTTVDGIQLPDGGEKREFNLDRMPSALVESVEVIRNRRADMEADGLAGRININLRDIPELTEWEIDAAGGLTSDDDRQYWGSIWGGGMLNDVVGLQAALSHSREALGKIKQKYDPSGALKETENEFKPLTSTDLMVDVLVEGESDALRFKPIFLNQIEEKEKRKDKYKDGAFDGADLETEDKTKRTVGGTLSWRHDFEALDGAAFEARLGYFMGSEDKEKLKRVLKSDGTEDTGKQEIETEDKTDDIFQIEAATTVPVFAGGIDSTLKFGGMYRSKDREKTKEKEKNGAPQSPGAKDLYVLEEDYYAAFVQNEMVFFEDRLTVIPGIRFEWVEQRTQSGTSGDTGSGSMSDVLPSIPVSLKLTDRWTLNGGVARVVNRPKFDYLVPYAEEKGDSIIVGNPALVPERGWSFDADLLYQDENLGLKFGVFHRKVNNRIEEIDTGLVENSKPVFMPENVGDGWTNGIILSQRVNLGFIDAPFLSGFTVGSHQNWARSELTEYATGEKRKFKEQPEFWGDLFIEWNDPQEKLSVAAAIGYTGEITSAGDGGDESREAEVSLDAKVSYRFNNVTELYLIGENLLRTERVKHKANGEREVEKGPLSVMAGLKAKF